jgi:hypothetical protein
MKTIMKKLIVVAIITGAMAFATTKASASIGAFPQVPLHISGVITYSDYQTNDNGKVTTSTPLKKERFTTKTLIGWLNASPAFVSALTNQYGASTNQIPPGSYFAWENIYDLVITNANGFSFNLTDNESGTNFGYIAITGPFMAGTFKRNDATGAGSETDEISIYFSFDDGNGNQFDLIGLAKLNWKYGDVSNDFQKTSLSVSIHGISDNSADLNIAGDSYGGVATFTATGSGKGIDPAQFFPFYLFLPRR